MYFITKKDSETGKNFTQVFDKSEECWNVQKELAEKYNIKEWRGAFWTVWGGFSSVIFNDGVEIDSKIWKQVRTNEYFPKKNSKAGKELAKEFEAMPTIGNNTLNGCIGFDDIFKTIGFNSNNDEYFGFAINEDWDVKILPEWEEITTTKYNELFRDSDT